MKLTITARKFDLTKELKAYIEKSIQSLTSFLKMIPRQKYTVR